MDKLVILINLLMLTLMTIIATAKEINSLDRMRPILDYLQEKCSFEQIKFALTKFLNANN